jgi:iron complex transport system substrate-binding protein
MSLLIPRVARCLPLAAAAVLILAAPPAGAQSAPPRVAALTPFSANVLAGLGVRPVAVGQTLGGRDRIDRRLSGVPVLPLAHPNGPNLEQLATRDPRLVLSSLTWNRGHGAMRRLGMRVEVAEPRTVASVPAQVQRIGRLVGRPRQARDLARRIGADVRRAQQGIRRRPTVLVLLAVGRTPYAMLANSWGGDLVRRAGGRLLTEGLRAPGGYARISNEAVIERNPDVIIAVPHGNVDDLPRLAAYLRTNPAWRQTNAARDGRIHVSTGNSLLQAWTDVGRTIRDVRRAYLRN